MKEPTRPVLKADKTLRRQVFVALGVGSAMAAIALHWLWHWLQDLLTMAETSPQVALEQLGWMMGGFLGAASAGLLVTAGWMVWFCLRAKRSQQFPPPGTRVILDTPITVGVAAQRKAMVGLGLAVILAGFSVLLPWQCWRLYQTLTLTAIDRVH